MSQPIAIVAQYAMDQFYQNYRAWSDFFTLKDFIFNCQAQIAAAFQQGFDVEAAKLRQEKQDEVVAFSHDWLSEQVLKVQRKSHETFAVLSQRPMSFAYDKQDSGIQEVFALYPRDAELERSNLTETWQYKYLPATNRIFWRIDRGKIKFFNKGICNIDEVRVLFVPAVAENMDVPDGVIELAITNTVAKMKQLAQGIVIKKSLDGNDNKTLETEIDRSALK